MNYSHSSWSGVRWLVGVLLAAPFVPVPLAGAADTPATNIENSVVKVFATLRGPDPIRPWSKAAPQEISGSGVVIDGKRILTNAHMVLYASQVQIQPKSGDKVSATVEAVAPGIDLAVLKLDDNAFFDTHLPVPFSTTLPDVKDTVMVYGYPTGGSTLSITKGIISRIEFAPYNFPTSGLRIQIDASINPGNSGGPVFAGDKMIGLAFSRLGGADNIGYIIPSEEIDLFLKDIADGKYNGKPALFDDLQTLENPALRAFLKLDKNVEGIVVHEPDSKDPNYPLKKWDLITKIADTAVDDEGMIKIGDNLRLRFRYLVQKVAKNGKVPLTVIREGKEIVVEVPVPTTHPMLIPELDGYYPSYFVYGPVAFSPATDDFIGSLGGTRVMGMLSMIDSPLVSRRGDKPAFDGEQLVVVSSPFFPHKLVNGYSNPVSKVVKTINGVKIKNLNHLVETLRDLQDEFVCIEFDDRDSETLVLPRKDVLAATEDILTDNGVRSQGSTDTMAIWNTKPAAK